MLPFTFQMSNTIAEVPHRCVTIGKAVKKTLGEQTHTSTLKIRCNLHINIEVDPVVNFLGI